MTKTFTEASYENAIIQLFCQMGYKHVYGPDVERDFYSPLYESELSDSLCHINPKLPQDAITEAIYKLKNFENGELSQKNEIFTDYIQNGVEVSYFEKGAQRSALVKLVDYFDAAKNSFVVANQWTFIENSNKRPDVILFLNGLPVVLMELKSPSRSETDSSEAFKQIRTYMHEIPTICKRRWKAPRLLLSQTATIWTTNFTDSLQSAKTFCCDVREANSFANSSSRKEPKRFTRLAFGASCKRNLFYYDAKI